MSWTAPRTWTTGEVITAAELNQQLRDNMLQTSTALASASGDIFYATGANALTRLAKGANGTFLTLASGLPAWAVAPVGTFNVKSYGAIGDGTTDDTTAIQSAITAAQSAGGGSVYFPVATYKITSALTVAASGVRLFGDGPGSILKQFTAAADSIQLGSAVTQYSGMGVDNLTILAGATKTGGAAIAVQNAVYTKLARLYITNQYRGVNVYDKNFGTSIVDCVITGSVESGIRYTSTGASNATNGLFLMNDVLDNPSGSQPTVSGINWINGEGLYAVNCEIVRQNTGILLTPGASQGCKWGFFTNVLCDLGNGNGLECSTVATAGVFGNVFANCWFATSGVHGVYLHPAASTFDGMEFDGCRALNNAQHGWFIGQYCDHVKINGGFAVGNSATTTNTSDGVYVENGTGGNSTDALTIMGLVSKGAIWGYANNQRYGINYAGTSIDNTIVMNCDLRNNGTGAFNNLPSTGEHRIFGNLGATRSMLGGEAIGFPELGSDPTGIANLGQVWGKDNGAGKTKIMAIFGSGAAQQIAIEP